MLGLDVLAAHLFGDFVLQVWRIPAEKLTNWRIRTVHVAAYTLCFLPVALVHAHSVEDGLLFLAVVAVGHFITDCRRWASAESWAPRPILVDQALHILQLAVFVRVLAGSTTAFVAAAATVAGLLLLWMVYELLDRRSAAA